jgi:UDP:flavonoid glycosyltransferase YjiC (YdhE family)
LLPAIEQAGFVAFDTGGRTFRDEALRRPLLKLDMEREYRSVSQGYAGDIAGQRVPAIMDRILLWRPELLVCDEMDFGCMVAAERLSVPYATMLVIASGLLANHNLIAGPLNGLRTKHGLPADPELTMLSRYLVLSPFPQALRDPLTPLPATAHAFCPVVLGKGGWQEPPSWLADLPERPTIYATLGTVFNVEAGDLFQRVLEGLRTLPINLIVTVGPQIAPAEFGAQPDNVRIERFVDQWLLLPRCDLVVAHAGSGTVFGALAHGLPMLLLPMGADQPFNARRCEALGTAKVLDPVDATPKSLREAAVALLASAQYRKEAERLRTEIAALPGQETAVALLAKLARERIPLIAD